MQPPATSVEIEIRGLSKWYGTHQVLKSLSTDVRRGEAVVLIGPSGSGKTTFLRCINLLEQFQEGEIRIGGESMGYQTDATGRRRRRSERDIARLRAKVGMVFQTLLARVGLADKLDVVPGRLSGGQQQRVAIARALAMSPKAMLFDEVTSALDPELVAEVLDVMRQLRDDGMTMVIVTHEMTFARAFANRILFMADGTILEQGPPAELFGDPKTARLQAFLKRFREGHQL